MTQKLSVDAEQEHLITTKNDIKTCENCHAQVEGMYCGNCGQSIESTLKYFWTVILHFLDDILSFDSRASRTFMPLFFRPGFLTNEYVKGRRVHYVPPLRLYLFISIVFFISLKFLTNNGAISIQSHSEQLSQQVTSKIELLKKSSETLSHENLTENRRIIEQLSTLQKDLLNKENTFISGTALKLLHIELGRIDEDKQLTDKEKDKKQALYNRLDQAKQGVKLVEESIFSVENNTDGALTLSFLSNENNDKLKAYANVLEKKAKQAMNSDIRPLIKESISKLPQLMFILLPLFALILKFTYLFQKRLYLEHLTVALHSHSFIFLTILLLLLCDLVQDSIGITYSLTRDILGFVNVVLLLWLPIYLFKTQKCIYKQGFLVTSIKFAFVGILYMMLIVITAVIAFVWGLSDI